MTDNTAIAYDENCEVDEAVRQAALRPPPEPKINVMDAWKHLDRRNKFIVILTWVCFLSMGLMLFFLGHFFAEKTSSVRSHKRDLPGSIEPRAILASSTTVALVTAVPSTSIVGPRFSFTKDTPAATSTVADSLNATASTTAPGTVSKSRSQTPVPAELTPRVSYNLTRSQPRRALRRGPVRSCNGRDDCFIGIEGDNVRG